MKPIDTQGPPGQPVPVTPRRAEVRGGHLEGHTEDVQHKTRMSLLGQGLTGPPPPHTVVSPVPSVGTVDGTRPAHAGPLLHNKSSSTPYLHPMLEDVCTQICDRRVNRLS